MSSDPSRRRGCALVTGASGGIGAAVARSLADAGWPVAVGYASGRERAEAVVEAIRSAGGQAIAAGADLADPAAADALVELAETRLDQPLLVLVNNAGVARDALVSDVEDAHWQEMIDVNLTGALRLMRRALGSMSALRFGRIVNVASVVADRANPGQAGYAASKAGLIALTRTAAAEVARRRITINAIAPGVIGTDTVEGREVALRARVPAGRCGTAEEVAACARFLVSDEAAYVTGSVLTVDGGVTA